MKTIQVLVKRDPLAAFFVLSFALSWWPWPLYAAGLSPAPIIGFGPFLAALIVLALTNGRQDVKDLIRRMLQWRVGWGWYVLAIGLPVSITWTAALINLRLGASLTAPLSIDALPGLGITFLLLLLVPGIGGAWEEPGWRGYALLRLQKNYPGSIASLLLGLVWGLWHLPLFLTQIIPWPDIVMIAGISIVYTWIYNHTQGSVFILMLTHAAGNTIGGGYFSPMFSGVDAARMSWLLAVLWWVMAYVLILIFGFDLSRKANTPTPMDKISNLRGVEKSH